MDNDRQPFGWVVAYCVLAMFLFAAWLVFALMPHPKQAVIDDARGASTYGDVIMTCFNKNAAGHRVTIRIDGGADYEMFCPSNGGVQWGIEVPAVVAEK